MRSLTFFTSNPTKLSHARYIAERHPISVAGFREKTYHAGYHEPRLHSRDEILKSSYESAKEQLVKSGLSADSHPFILEDTSVRIDALSDAEREVPGVDIKYWMEEQNFEKLNSALERAGGNRSATVRSDVLLHVPKNLRRRWDVDSDYLVFTGRQVGHVVAHESSYESNLVFPWLDNQSFNRWFCPDGATGPFGSLPIQEADEYDFRRASFEQLFSFLGKKGYFAPKAEQMNLPLEDDPVAILLTGFTCAGKTTASQFLSDKYDFLHLEASDFMQLSYFLRHGFERDVDVGDFAESALVQKPLIAAEKVVNFIRSNRAGNVVVSGFRAPDEVAFLEQELSVLGRNLVHLFVDSPAAVRFERMQNRNRPGDQISFEKFCSKDLQQERMGLSKIKHGMGATPLQNLTTIDDLCSQIEVLAGLDEVANIAPKLNLELMKSKTSIGLEKAILLALLSVWVASEDREFYTTTQIARLIEQALPNVTAKHKDNVSRYFNQNFHPYYEISVNAEASTRRYRLSNTGYGLAMRALRREHAGIQV